ncbi:MAG: allophanate hydrolase [Pseudomonadota bacterium]
MDFRIEALAGHYRNGLLSPRWVIEEVLQRISNYSDPAVWISRVPEPDLLFDAERLEALAPSERGPLYGIPFAVKDNIDVAGMDTTAACPGATYRAERSATVVNRLIAAGAILVGKTNLDQFATGLVGVRSPYGAPRSVFDRSVISGGSSSGSAVAVAAGLVSFALGTDTAGSGRVPAAFNNIVGIKPTCGRISTQGVIPANRMLDCVSIFANTVADGRAVMSLAAGFDTGDPFSRRHEPRPLAQDGLRLGVPTPESRTFYGDVDAEAAYEAALERLAALGHTPVPFDFTPFAETARMLYGSAWLAERTTAIKPILDGNRDILHPVTRAIIEDGLDYTATDAFGAIYQAAEAKQAGAAVWRDIDAMVLPTTPSIYRVDQVEADPIELNRRLGYYTNFVNLMDLASIAIPGGFRDDQLPHGTMLVAPAHTDDALSEIAASMHAALEPSYGACRRPLPLSDASPDAPPGMVRLAVVGAHLSGQPLNRQLTDNGAVMERKTKTAADYRLFALPNTKPAKPGLAKSLGFNGPGIEVEVWRMPVAGFGRLVALVPPPLAIGTVTLADHSNVKGFITEGHALEGSKDITSYGGWRTYLADN